MELAGGTNIYQHRRLLMKKSRFKDFFDNLHINILTQQACRGIEFCARQDKYKGRFDIPL
jgi:hypothetical protein